MIGAQTNCAPGHVDRFAASVSRRRVACVLGGLLMLTAGSACTEKRVKQEVVAPYVYPMTVAVGPALNFSNASAVDPVKMADLMASELSQWGGVNVIGVNRVMAVLAREGRQNVESPAHAIKLCEQLGADAILIFAVEEYDPYMPPVVRFSAQIYGPHARELGFDPIAASRQARPFADVPELPEEQRPWSQMQRTYNSAHETVQRDVESYARGRDAENSPMGWRKYLASQELYVRYCCFRTITELMRQEGARTAGEQVAMKESNL